MTTIIDTVEGLEFLREHGIAIAPTRYVDGSEDAVFFAAGRPVALRIAASAVGGIARSEAPPEAGLRTASAIRQAYDRLAPARVIAQHQAEAGTNITIEGRDDEKIGRIVELRCGAHTVHRLHPLSLEQAESMLSEFRSKRGIAASEKAARMLTHLLVRVSEVYEDESISRLLLDPVRLHDNRYEVLDAAIWSKRALRLNPRLDKHARDKKTFYQP
jgi:ATP-grasp domain